MSKTVVKLKYPFDFEGEAITEISLRRAKYKDMKAVRELGEGAVLDTLLCNLSEQSPDLIDEIDPVDIAVIEKVIMGFLGVTATD